MDGPAQALVRYETAGGTATITLDSPRNRNALSRQLMAEFGAAMDSVRADPGVRVVVLTGAGPVFCSGADLAEQRAANEAGTTASLGWALPDLLTGLADLPQPVVAAVNGPARAGGLGLIAACDLALAPTGATFAFTEVRLGVVPAVISVPVLRLLPARAAAELFLTGEVFDARRAVEIGLLTRAVAAAELPAATRGYVEALLRGGPEALGHTKQVLRRVPRLDRDEAYTAMLALSLDRFGSAEAREGMAAFAAKRPPAWVPG